MITRFSVGILLVIFSFIAQAQTGSASTSTPAAQNLAPANNLLFRTAEQALQSGKRTLFATLAGTLDKHPLYPYLIYTDLRRRLSDNTPPVDAAEVRDFLNRYTDTPLRQRLLHAWIEYLAAQKRWQMLLEDYRPNDDTSLQCLQRQALLALGRTDEAIRDIESIWMSAKSQPKSCDPLFAIWKKQGGITQARLWQRFVLAMDANQVSLARYLHQSLNGPEQAQAALWLQVHANPQQVLDRRLFDIAQPSTAMILLHGLKRWVQRDSVAAAPALDNIKMRYALEPSTELKALEKRLALYLAARGDHDAERRLAALDPWQIDEAVHAWRVRIALRNADWHSVRQHIEQMPSQLRESLQWQYWLARALDGGGDKKAARELFTKLAKHRDYFGFLAADRLQLPYQMQHQPLAIDDAALAPIQRLPGIRRAQALLMLGEANNARIEWEFALRSADQKQLAGAAKIAHTWNWHDRAIATLARADIWNDIEIRFPLPYRSESQHYAELQGIDLAWVYALMRQESLFRADIGSAAGALGLMQIMPATGQKIAQELDLKWNNRFDLLQPDLNIRFGTYYLRQNLDRLQDNLLLATASYNAGPHRVASWLPRASDVDADIWAETIPFSETRKYVIRVLEYTAVYEHRLGLVLTRLQKRMPLIFPSGDA